MVECLSVCFLRMSLQSKILESLYFSRILYCIEVTHSNTLITYKALKIVSNLKAFPANSR